MDPAALKAVILAQSAGSPVRVAYAAGNDVEACRLLRLPANPLATRPRDCEPGVFVSALYDAGLWSVVQAAAVNQALPQNLRDACTRVMRMEISPHYTSVEAGKAVPLLQAFVGAGLATSQQAAPVLALFSEPDPTPLADCTPDDVYRTRSVP